MMFSMEDKQNKTGNQTSVLHTDSAIFAKFAKSAQFEPGNMSTQTLYL